MLKYFFFLACFTQLTAFADIEPLPTPSPSPSPSESINKTFAANPEITDPKLLADDGSRSRYSLKFNLTYAGPTLSNLSEKDQPNPDGTVGSFQTALAGTVGARYRLTPQSTVGVSTGLRAIYPMQGIERVDLSNPILSYNYAGRIGDVQAMNSPGVVWRTVPEFTRIGQYSYLLDNESFIYNLGTSGFALGADVAFGYFMYNRDYRKSDGKAPRYSFEVDPALKYNFSDKFSILTSSIITLWNPRSRTNSYALLNKSVNQRLGLGYAFTKEIYVNPYLTFYPQHLAWSGTTINLAMIFSVL